MEERQALEEYNEELEAGTAEIEAGNFITTEQLKEEIKKWCLPESHDTI